jgi:hypothetical protein
VLNQKDLVKELIVQEKEKDVKVVDNFLPVPLIKLLHQHILKDLPHTMTGCSKEGDTPFYYVDLQNEFFLNKIILTYICNTLKINLTLIRMYCNVQYQHMNGEWHTDTGDGSSRTVLIMISDTLSKNSGCFCTKNNKYDFIQNRLLFFPADIIHKGLAPTEKGVARITLACKTKLI